VCMKYAATRVTLRGRERRVLQRVVRAHTSEQREVLRARIVLMASLGDNNCEIARELFCDLKTVRKWRARFAELRLEGLWDAPRSGRPEQFTVSQRHETFAVMALTPPFPYARWSVQPAQRLGLHIVPTLSVHIHESTAASNTHNFACRPLRPGVGTKPTLQFLDNLSGHLT